jgi:hypothetical protein
MMQRRAEAMVIDAVSTYFHHATAGLGPELETYQDKDWRKRIAARSSVIKATGQ